MTWKNTLSQTPYDVSRNLSHFDEILFRLSEFLPTPLPEAPESVEFCEASEEILLADVDALLLSISEE